MTTPVDLDTVERWLGAGEAEVRKALIKGASPQRIAFLEGSLAMVKMLEDEVHGPAFVAAPETGTPSTPTPVNLDYMAAIDGEKLTEYLKRTKEEAINRDQPDVVGFIQALEFHFDTGSFEERPEPQIVEVQVAAKPTKPKKYMVPTRDGNMKPDEAFNTIVNARSADKYRAIYAALQDGPVTDDELRDRLQDMGHGMVPGTVTAYRGDLARAGWVSDTGERRKSDSGSTMKVWAVTI